MSVRTGGKNNLNFSLRCVQNGEIYNDYKLCSPKREAVIQIQL